MNENILIVMNASTHSFIWTCILIQSRSSSLWLRSAIFLTPHCDNRCPKICIWYLRNTNDENKNVSAPQLIKIQNIETPTWCTYNIPKTNLLSFICFNQLGYLWMILEKSVISSLYIKWIWRESYQNRKGSVLFSDKIEGPVVPTHPKNIHKLTLKIRRRAIFFAAK